MTSAYFLLIILIVGVSYTPGCQAEGFEGIFQVLTQRVAGLWSQGDMELLGNLCTFETQPRIRKWKLQFVSAVWCPGWTPIKGRGMWVSRSGSLVDATRDFLKQSVDKGIITKEEADNWME